MWSAVLLFTSILHCATPRRSKLVQTNIASRFQEFWTEPVQEPRTVWWKDVCVDSRNHIINVRLYYPSCILKKMESYFLTCLISLELDFVFNDLIGMIVLEMKYYFDLKFLFDFCGVILYFLLCCTWSDAFHILIKNEQRVQVLWAPTGWRMPSMENQTLETQLERNLTPLN